ncbi:hypothetical protein PybrP1_001401 [[Pythium] brassicae (nom. inval.)]|nr:hypothetical protein PybrP1_001401 [[Pythium] brassicae (nom. inval.)]
MGESSVTVLTSTSCKFERRILPTSHSPSQHQCEVVRVRLHEPVAHTLPTLPHRAASTWEGGGGAEQVWRRVSRYELRLRVWRRKRVVSPRVRD